MDNLGWKWMKWMGKKEFDGIVLEEVEKCGIGNVQNHFSAVFSVLQCVVCLKLSEIREKILVFAEF